MRNPRRYILDEGRRVYTDGAKEHYEYSCDHCVEEVPESGMYTLNGILNHKYLGPADEPHSNAHLHEDCVLPYVTEQLAQVKACRASTASAVSA